MTISCDIDHTINLATFTVTGSITLDEARDIVERFYNRPTKNVLWDLISASELNFRLDEVREIASYPKRVENNVRINGKTAIAAQKDLIYGLGRMFQSFSEMNRVPFEVMIFRTIAEAKAWLEDDDAQEAL